MGHLHNFHKHQRPSLLSSIGQKVKTGLEIAGTVKGLYDIGRSIYGAYQVVRPAIAAAATVGALL